MSSAVMREPVADPTPRRARRGWRWWVYSALMVAAVGWLLFVIAHVILSGRWWFWLIIDILPPGLLVVAPLVLAAGAWPCRRSRRPVLTLSLAALLIGLPFAGVNFRSFERPPPAPADALTVFAWNTEYWDQSGPFYQVLLDQDADLYLLSEYVYDEYPPRRIDAVPQLRSLFPGYHIAVAGELVTISRLPIVRQYALPVAGVEDPDPWLTEYGNDKILRTDVDLGGRTLSVYNAHIPVQLSPGLSPLGGDFYRVARDQWTHREAQWKALNLDVAANPHPVLIAGDLNTTAAMGDLRKLPDRLRDASGALSDVYPLTWFDRPGLPRWWRLDWTFVSDDVAVHRYEFGSTAGLSDHRYQVLDVSLS